MASTNPKEKIDLIEEQIKKLKEKKQRLQAKTERELGGFLLKSWDAKELDIDLIKNTIDLLQEEAKKQLHNSNDSGENNSLQNGDINAIPSKQY
ncbi:hypothetical protein ACTOS9_21830 (plasmid) [Bacillus subtilis]|uniref:Uncharacterized protein n=1 Tax=Bacillus subtilis TaxID=1423 RepID=A0A8I1WGL0_BACIU|nr:hypothetical protein [Bacillus subtilis]MBO3796460.1 hypothetical protein [Bacillus subtilis]WEY82944.1 hypothetical protein P5633_00060 [Bacillus subtilis]WGD72633.1 hypothetical protein P5645_22180 [Bacillus subtilis]